MNLLDVAFSPFGGIIFAIIPLLIIFVVALLIAAIITIIVVLVKNKKMDSKTQKESSEDKWKQ